MTGDLSDKMASKIGSLWYGNHSGSSLSKC